MGSATPGENAALKAVRISAKLMKPRSEDRCRRAVAKVSADRVRQVLQVIGCRGIRDCGNGIRWLPWLLSWLAL
jgi:hypothetical protein